MIKTTLGRLLIEQALPPAMRGRNFVFDKDGLKNVFQELAENHPDEYRQTAKRLSDVGRDITTSTGSFSFGLKHMQRSQAARRIQAELRYDVDQILQDDSLTDEARDAKIIELVRSRQKGVTKEIFDEGKAEKNPLTMQIQSGARGNPGNFGSLRIGDLLYVDHKNRELPIPVLRGYSQGLSPAEYFAGTFGARKSVLDTKGATQDAGFLAKQLNQVSHRLVVTDDDDEPDRDPGLRGLPSEVDDDDNVGALLAQPVGHYPRNTVITPKILRDIRTMGPKRILVRSPMVGGPADGVYARDVGMRERGFMPRRGDFVGLAAAQALSEKLTQGQLSSKHAGGVAGADKAVSGFALINQLVQIPKTFRGGATHAQADGRVHKIEPASQGGSYVTVGSDKHYVPAGFDLKVKVGDDVEAGDVMSDGIPNPYEITRHKGNGEGMRYFVNTFMNAYRDAGMGAHRRNVELLARGLINHVQLDDEYGDNVPDDIVPYNVIERSWKPRDGYRTMAPSAATGKHLEKPVLHYTIGTKIRPSVVRDLQEFGVKSIDVHDDPPPFRPTMIRGMGSMEHDPDWMTRHIGSNLERSTLHALHTGAKSDPLGTSYASAMSLNPTGFGLEGNTKGWKADPAPPKPAPRSALDNLLAPD